MGELGLGGELLLGHREAAVDLLAVVGPRPCRRSRSASSEGGEMNTCTASGIAARTWRAPWTSISSTTGTPRCTRRSSSERSVP